MGYNSVVLVLNDQLGDIEKDPEGFVQNMVGAILRGQNGPHGETFWPGQTTMVQTFHADECKLIMVGANSATVVGSYHGLWQHNNARTRVDILERALNEHGYEIRSMPVGRLAALVKKAKTALDRAVDITQTDPHHNRTRWRQAKRIRENLHDFLAERLDIAKKRAENKKRQEK